ncbi:hypothetical protein DP107_07665 [Haloglomus irregulare]|uniref:Uncharacterized protein n=1 Tax=Haloglomus irregulare TaxID=2234134 RepID=A0A554NBS1_9EURY|nr:hypothetical protein [Haloglomus irregulare]TSD14831.1 hypothetical protein DP107_07665 [Haloglomus irregulare]
MSDSVSAVLSTAFGAAVVAAGAWYLSERSAVGSAPDPDPDSLLAGFGVEGHRECFKSGQARCGRGRAEETNQRRCPYMFPQNVGMSRPERKRLESMVQAEERQSGGR